MPKRGQGEWDGCKLMFVKGATLPEIAKIKGVSYPALRARAHREGWKADATAVATTMQQSATLTLQERAIAWGSKVADVVEKHLDFVANKEPGALKLSEVETLTRILGNTDATARRTFGLDKSDQSKAAVVGVKLNLRIASGDVSTGAVDKTQAIDAEVVNDDVPPA